jgi:hypothetical protein
VTKALAGIQKGIGVLDDRRAELATAGPAVADLRDGDDEDDEDDDEGGLLDDDEDARRPSYR